MDDDATKLKALIASDPRNTSTLAREAGVDYQQLYRWLTGRTETYDVKEAGKVYLLLTGNELIR